MAIEIVPAILAKTRAELAEKISSVAPFVRTVQIDVMDGNFVPNTTVGLKDFRELPSSVKYEYHWMVERPWEWIAKTKNGALHIVHIETVNSKEEWELVKAAAAKSRAKLGLALNPDTYLNRIYPYVNEVSLILVMTVVPGFSGQGYIREMERKIIEARALFPELDIEVDGGVTAETLPGARAAGANRFAAASAIFAEKDRGKAVKKLLNIAGG
jgi:ribulose-phosphate 3-epimerase